MQSRVEYETVRIYQKHLQYSTTKATNMFEPAVSCAKTHSWQKEERLEDDSYILPHILYALTEIRARITFSQLLSEKHRAVSSRENTKM
ncbi:hypothetical protein MPTK1_7g08330 [Marchantia polymorpha subsp. ruderalis]|uniref:Uncharacterized protein n=2 Tax=Marchantia polymorpha TaxID=3197 RepID=A0AAF6BXD6_MARPO|nr:hypothetical protein MARPO_0146s0033 [Marchantia polymorpha]BBN16670.1 hypothetical protein Mp_7g08330 [Marchantia polymorpha subsp. ruderalis]|eukprot:PTQ29217.1 hypothetical protein MARPO_0146s0033 [Marchantia polymorpha]